MNDWLQTGVSGFLAQDQMIYHAFWRLGLLSYIIILVALALLAFDKQEGGNLSSRLAYARVPNWVLHPALFLFVALTGAMVLWLPAFGVWEANVDEGLWIAGALTLAKDPRFWYSVDGTTGGPLLMYPLMLFPSLGMGLGYGVIRILTLVVTLISMACLYGVFRNLFNEAWARVLALPYIVILASMNYVDFIAYNSEIIPLFFLNLALFFVVLALKKVPWQPIPCLLLAGFCLGCLPYAKLQSVPLGLAVALVVGLWLLWQKRWGGLVAFVVGGLFPSGIVLTYLVVNGLVSDFWISYIEANLNFASKGFDGLELSFAFTVYRLVKKSLIGAFMFPWTITFGVSLVVLGFLAFQARFVWLRRYGGWAVMAALLLAMGIYVNLKPSTHHWHHFLFLFLPLSFTAGLLLGFAFLRDQSSQAFSFSQGRGLLATMYLLVLTLLPGFYFAGQGNRAISMAEKHYQRGSNSSQMALKILEYAKPGDRLAVWGFMHHLYVETGLAQGTREAMPQFQIQIDKFDLPHKEYYFERYVNDLRTRRPRVLIESVGPEDKRFNEDIYRHSNYPLVRDHVAQYYDLVHDESAFRLYVLKDNLPEASQPERLPDPPPS